MINIKKYYTSKTSEIRLAQEINILQLIENINEILIPFGLCALKVLEV